MTITKLSLPFMLLGPVLAATAGAGGSWAVTRAQVDTVAAQVSELRDSDKQNQRQVFEAALRFQRIEIALERIERKLGTDR